MAYLPFAHTDFIFPIIGEELGVYYTLGVVLCFVLILAAGYVIALHAPDRFGRLLAFGLTTAIVLQAALNIAVTTGTLPNKGLPLPFVSYGGSNLLFCLGSLGIISKYLSPGNESPCHFGTKDQQVEGDAEVVTTELDSWREASNSFRRL